MKRILLCLAAMAGALITSAIGSPLPPPSTLAHCAVNSSVVDDPVSCVLGVSDRAFASLSLSPFIRLTAQAVSPLAPGLHGAGATADVNYAFQVIGGNPGDIVPLLIATTLTTTSTESNSVFSYGFAALTVGTTAAGTATLVAVCTDGTCGTTATSFSGTVHTRARSGDTGNFLEIQVQASASGTGLISESASATGDPFIFVDPAFPDASLYSIIVSPGVANAADVPEAATGMLLVGGGLLFAAARGRRVE